VYRLGRIGDNRLVLSTDLTGLLKRLHGNKCVVVVSVHDLQTVSRSRSTSQPVDAAVIMGGINRFQRTIMTPTRSIN